MCTGRLLLSRGLAAAKARSLRREFRDDNGTFKVIRRSKIGKN